LPPGTLFYWSSVPSLGQKNLSAFPVGEVERHRTTEKQGKKRKRGSVERKKDNPRKRDRRLPVLKERQGKEEGSTGRWVIILEKP